MTDGPSNCRCGWKLPTIALGLPAGERMPASFTIAITCPECGTMLHQMAQDDEEQREQFEAKLNESKN